MFELRKYQNEGVEACLDILRSSKQCREVVVSPTGGGKSLYLAELTRRLDEPILVIQPSKELLKQNYEKFIKVGGKATLCCASLKTKTIDGEDYTEIDGKSVKCREVSRITFATPLTVIKHIEELKKLGVKKIALDECHLMTQSTTERRGKKTVEKQSQIKKLVKELGVTNICGLTATAIYLRGGLGGASLKIMTRVRWKLFTKVRHITQISHLVENGYWSKLLYQVNEVDDSALKHNSSGSDYTVESLKDYYDSNDLKGQIVEEVRNLLKEGRKSILVFVPTIAEANELFASFPNSAVVHSKIDEKTRDYVVGAFKSLDIPVVFNVNILSCLDLETEVLTETGWVGYKDMTYQHKVANWEDGKIYFEEPNNIIYRDIDENENYYRYESNSVNFRVTNKHDLILRNQREPSYNKIKVEDVQGRILKAPVFGSYIPKKVKVTQEKRNLKSSLKRRIVASAYNIRKKNPELTISESHSIALKGIEKRDSLRYKNPDELTVEECKLIGFFLGDGSMSNIGKNEKVYTITQSKAYPKIILEIDRLLSESGIQNNRKVNKPDAKSKYESVTWQLNKGTGYGDQRREGLFKIIPYLDKNGSPYLRYLNGEQFRSLLVGFWLADGNHGDSINKSSNGTNITNTNYGLLSLLQEIAVTRGIKANISKLSAPKNKKHRQMFMLQISEQKECTINNRFKIVKEGYKKEKTWCVSVSSTNILIRRKGKVMVIGNCGFDHPQLDAIITARPTSSIAVYYQQIGRGCRIHPEKDNCKIVDFSGNVSKFGIVEELEYCDIPYYGMGLFNAKGELLTDYPIQTVKKPTKESLIASYKAEKEKKSLPISTVPTNDNPEFYFGKHKGKKLQQVIKEDKQYCAWIIDQEGWNWHGVKGKTLERAIYKALRLPMPGEKKKETPNNTKDVKSFSEGLNLNNINTIF